MTGPPPVEKRYVSPQEGPRVPLVCMTCGATYQLGEKNPNETCGTVIRALTCSVANHHKVAYVSDWKLGMLCTEQQYSNCSGILENRGDTIECPGRLTKQSQSSS